MRFGPAGGAVARAVDARGSSAGRPAARSLGVAVALVGLVAGLVSATTPAAAAPPVSPVASGWLPSWATSAALAAVEANDDLFSDASPFWYSARASGGSVDITTSVSAATRADTLTRLRSRDIAVIPSVADQSGAREMAAILKVPSARRAHVDQLVTLVMDNGFDGVELDYERFAFSDGSSTWGTTRPAWVAFVTELAAALHDRGRLLALAVPPMYDGTSSSTSGYWVYDYAGVAGSVDSLRIMTYDYSVARPGPIAPLAFLRRTLSYAVTAFPADRIRMGVPAYGRVWTARRADGSPSITGTCPASGVPGTRSFRAAAARSFIEGEASSDVVFRFDAATGEQVATFSTEYTGVSAGGWTTTCVVDHEAWWVDARGVEARLPLVQEFGLAGVAIWHLGGVEAGSWQVMRSWAASRPGPSPSPSPTPTASGSPTGPVPPDPTGSPSTSGSPSASGSPTPTPSTSTSPAPTSPAPTSPAPTVSRPAQPIVPRVTVTTSTRRPRRGQVVAFRVKVRPALESVKVRRKMRWNGRWITKDVARTDARGRVVFRVRWPEATIKRTYKITTKKRGTLAAGRSQKFTLRTR